MTSSFSQTKYNYTSADLIDQSMITSGLFKKMTDEDWKGTLTYENSVQACHALLNIYDSSYDVLVMIIRT